jgi:pyruvate formate lyase activating enzyme
MKAVVTNIQGFSLHDGPGIRTVVFLKGCPLRCRWCANPETLLPGAEVGFIGKLCTGCGRCEPACPVGAVVPEAGAYRIDRGMCTSCGACVDACDYGALVRYGQEQTVEDVFDAVRRDGMFYSASGGGVTVSGGEPLLQAGFVEALFALCRAEGIHTCVETCGHVPQEAFARVLPLTDLFCYDLKLMDAARHRRFTGQPNEKVLANARFLIKAGASVEFRQPFIPGLNDDAHNIEATAAFVRSLGDGSAPLRLMPYHRMGQPKYEALRLPFAMEGIGAADEGAVMEAVLRYGALGVDCSVSR